MKAKSTPYPPCTVTVFCLKYQDLPGCLRRVTQPPFIAVRWLQYKTYNNMKHTFFIFSIIISINLFSQSTNKQEFKKKPDNLEGSLIQLDKLLPDSSKTKILSMTEKDYISQSHFSTGLWIRNYWLYDRYLFGLIVIKSNLRKELSSKGLFSNDDMSSVILCSYYRKLKNLEINLDQQIKDIHQWYINMNNPRWREEQDSISWSSYMKQFQIGDTLTDHVYYDRNWLGNPRKNTTVLAKVIDKSDKKLKIEIISFGTETDSSLIYNEIECESNNCWINPYLWKRLHPEDK
jgi:hypothetical protein